MANRLTTAGWGSALLVALCGLGALPGCKESSTAPPDDAGLVVFAATSLRDAFTAIGRDFQRAHPSTSITFNFAGTQELRTQLEHGATVDVFASADRRHMEELVRAARVIRPRVFARNEAVVVVSTEAAASVRRFADLPSARRIVLGAAEVPIGRYALEILQRAEPVLGADFSTRVMAKVASRELNVRQVLTKVSMGEAEAGIVYRTDVASAAGRVSVVEIPPEINVVADLVIAAADGAPHPQMAAAWVERVLSSDGQRALAAALFLPADGGAL